MSLLLNGVAATERGCLAARLLRVDDQVVSEPLPWATEPSAAGWALCRWCDRAIYRPAVPCSVKPFPGLLAMPTQPGQGERCKYELATRTAAGSL